MRARLLYAALLCALVTLSGCSLLPTKNTADPVPYEDYVALGDSYTAGPFISPAAEDSPAPCFRSRANYPGYLASYLKVKTLTDVSCSGATTDNLYSPQSTRMGLTPDPKADNPPQLNALTKSTDLVTLGIGGNDFELFSNMVLASNDRQDLETRLEHAAQVQPRVEAAITAIRDRAPHAKIIIVGYLRVFPRTGTCPALSLTPSDRDKADAIERRLNTSLGEAAASMNVTFIDAYALGTGHEVCAGKQAYVNGSRTTLFIAAAFHPFRRGMDAVARKTYATLTNNPAPKTPSFKKLAAIPR